MVELFVPATIWALVFLRFGLLPTALFHSLFDLMLFSIPLFIVETPQARVQQALVIAAALVPLAIVLVRRLRAGAWNELSPALRNGAWQVVAPAPGETSAAPTRAEIPRWALNFQRALPALGIAGLAGWLVATPFTPEVSGIDIGRAQAEAAADAALAQRGVTVGSPWKRFSVVRVARDDAAKWTTHRFVYSEAGPDAYRAAVGDVLAGPTWEVRYARFEGDIAERAEEWGVTIASDGRVSQVRHALPEQRPGARLSRDEAAAIAREAIKPAFGRDPSTLKDVGVEQLALPARVDWRFTYVDPNANVGPGGEARLFVVVAGDEIAGTGRYVHVPETWLREQTKREARLTVVRFAIGGTVLAAAIASLVFAVVLWARGRSDRRVLIGVAAVTLVVSVIGAANAWPLAAITLSTTEPLGTQVVLAIVGRMAGALGGALLIGLVGGVAAYAAAERPVHRIAGPMPAWAAGIGAALFAAGVAAVLAYFAPRMWPMWPDLALLSLELPSLGAFIAGARTLTTITGALFLLLVLERISASWRRRRWLVALVLVLVLAAMGVTASDPVAAMLRGIASGIVFAAVVFGLLRHDAAAVPAFAATSGSLAFIEEAVRGAWPAAPVHAAVFVVVAAAIAWIATRYIVAARTANSTAHSARFVDSVR
jgi:hypothetical protein